MQFFFIDSGMDIIYCLLSMLLQDLPSLPPTRCRSARWTTFPSSPCSQLCPRDCAVLQCLTHCNPMDCNLPGSSVHGDSPGKNFGLGCHALLQEIFPTQGLNPGLPHCRRFLYHLSHQGSLGVRDMAKESSLEHRFFFFTRWLSEIYCIPN